MAYELYPEIMGERIKAVAKTFALESTWKIMSSNPGSAKREETLQERND